MLGDRWGPLIVNSLEEMNVSIVTNMDPVINSCPRSLVLMGGRANYKTYLMSLVNMLHSNSGERQVGKVSIFF